jgi:CDP-diacylglycerol--serine O-phosphatidyltransferase
MTEIDNSGSGKRGRRSGIYLLPNLFTTAALFAGFYAMVAAIHSRFEAAAVSIMIAMILDGMDGRIARMTNTQSAFGAEYDSLSDMAAFGIAPALVMYQWALFDFGRLGWLAAFFFTAAAALRLARFNTQVDTADKRYFQGLPSPAAAGLIAGLVWLGTEYDLTGTALAMTALLLTLSGAVLMVSNVRYHSFKEFDLRERIRFVSMIAIVLALAFVSLEPALVLFTGFAGYAASGPLLTLIHIQRHRRARRGE